MQVRAEPLSGLLDLQGSFLPSPDGVWGQGVQVALQEAPADSPVQALLTPRTTGSSPGPASVPRDSVAVASLGLPLW